MEEEFSKYVSNYDLSNTNINRKYNHSFRVMELSKKYSKMLGFNKHDIELATVIGLLHDIGRFEQWKVYGTFIDRYSVDHADYGVEVLTKDNYLRKYIKDDKYDKIILDAIGYHNKYKLPDDLGGQGKMFAQIIRDADKIDILYLRVIQELKIEIDENALSDDIYKSLINKKDIQIKDLKTKTDRLGITLGFIFDINYKESYKILKEVKYFDKIIDLYKEKTDNEELKRQLEEIRKTINEYIEVNLC